MKKIAWLLALAMLLTCFVGCSRSKKTELEKAFTTVPVDGGVKITQYSGNYTSLEIPSTIGRKKVVEIGNDVFAKSYLLTEVVIPDTVKKIGVRAFQGCLALESIVIPDSVQEIGDYAFFGCWAAKTLEIGSGYATIFEDVDWIVVDVGTEGVGELSTCGVRYGDEVFDIDGLFDLTANVFGHDSDF